MTADYSVTINDKYDNDEIFDFCLGKNYAYIQLLKLEENKFENPSRQDELLNILNQYNVPENIIQEIDSQMKSNKSNVFNDEILATYDQWKKIYNFIKNYGNASKEDREKMEYVGDLGTIKATDTFKNSESRVLWIHESQSRNYYWYDRETNQFLTEQLEELNNAIECVADHLGKENTIITFIIED